jgi:hypothetical protein
MFGVDFHRLYLRYSESEYPVTLTIKEDEPRIGSSSFVLGASIH